MEIDTDPTESDRTKAWLEWCRSQTGVVCTEYPVPENILPRKLCRAILVDVKVRAEGKPDDLIYSENEEFRRKIARGNCVLAFHNVVKGQTISTQYKFIVFGLKKYSGGTGEEDDITPTMPPGWEPYFVQPMSSVSTIISTEKENGDVAHIGCLRIGGEAYFCIGSKNVHLLARNMDDVNQYRNARFTIARRVAQVFFESLLNNSARMDSLKKESFTNFLIDNEYTLVAEMLLPENQHLAKVPLAEPDLRFLCWSKPDLEGDFQSDATLSPMPVHEGIEKAREFGLSTVKYEVVAVNSEAVLSKLEQHVQQIRQDMSGSEGKVLYFLDAKNSTIGLMKKKTALYVILRALREKVAQFNASQTERNLAERCTLVEEAIRKIQKWQGFSDAYAARWIKIATSFVKWDFELEKKAEGYTHRVRSCFAVVFQEFLDDTRNLDIKDEFSKLHGTF